MLLASEAPTLLGLEDRLPRSACDRCRCQKLRCERPTVVSSGSGSGSGTQRSGPPRPAGPLAACRRCQRVGAVCTTSFQQRPGRPRLSEDRGRLGSQGQGGRQQQQQQQHSSRAANRRARTARTHASTNTSREGTYAAETRQSADWADARSTPTATVPFLPRQHSPKNSPAESSEQALTPMRPLPGDGHVSSGLDLDSVTTVAVGHDDPGFWDLSPGDMMSSWAWEVEDLPGMATTEKETSSADVAALGDAVDTAVAPPPAVGNSWSDRIDLCQQLADLSHLLSRDVQGLLMDESLSPRQTSSGGLGLEENSRIRRTFKSFETLGNLIDELRMKTHNSQGAMLTPVSTRGSSTRPSPVSKEGAGRIASAEAPDHHLNMVMALHVVTSYVCLNHILKHTLSSIHAAVSQSANGSVWQLPRLPGIQIEGLPGNSDHLRVRLFAETCMHVATGIHKRMEALALEKNLGCGFSRPINMALGKGSCDEADVDIRGIKVLCSQISSAIEEHAW